MRTLSASLLLAFHMTGAVHHHKPVDRPTAQHTHQYNVTYATVAKRFGKRTPGRNIIRYGFSPHHPATDQQVVASLVVLHRMLAPPPAPTAAAAATQSAASGTTGGPVSVPSSTVATGGSAPAGGLMACIISHESGGNPMATNGQYAGIGQWSPAAWAQDGGTKYASSPTGASYSQQAAVLAGEGTAGMRSQQGQYDGC